MISAAQAASFRETATRNLEEGFATVIRFPEDQTNTDIPCARWSQTSGGQTDGLAGLIQTYDVAFRVRAALIPAGVKLTPDKTLLSEDGKRFRLANVRTAKNDPAIVLECKAI